MAAISFDDLNSENTQSGGVLTFDDLVAPKPKKSFADQAKDVFTDYQLGGLQGMANIGNTIMRPVDYIARDWFGATGDNALGLGRTDRKEATKAGMASLSDLVGVKYNPESGVFKTGEFASEVAGTLGAGGTIAKGLDAASLIVPRGANLLQRLAAAAETGGATAASPNAGRVSNTLVRMAGGAAAGGAGAALIDPESAGTGATIGAVIPAVGAVAGKVAQGSGWLSDLVTGGTNRLAERHVGRIAREAAENKAAAIAARNAVADPSLLATQASAGINKPTWNAMGDWAEMHGANTYDPIRQEQQALQRLTLEDIAGGGTQTAARDTAEGAHTALNKSTKPIREKILADANIGAKVGIPLQAEADRFSQAAASKVDDVRRISGAQQKAEEMAQLGYGTLASNIPREVGMPRISGKYSYPGELTQVAERGAQPAADASSIFGDAARFAQMKADSVAQAGYKPINTGKLISALESKLNSPQIWPSDPDAKAIATVIAKLKEGNTRGGGVIDSDAIYTIRKNTIGDAIESQLVGYDPKAKAERVSSILTSIKPLIDDAINEAAGNKDWITKYLKPYEEGMKKIEQKKMGAKALEMFDKSPEGYAELARGNKPKQVQNIFKTEYDIQKAMGDQFPGMRNVGNEVLRDAEIARQAKVGKTQFDEIFKKHQSGLRAPGLIDATITVFNKGLGNIEGRINDNIKTIIINGMRSGANANELLAMLPAEERNAAIMWLAKGGADRYMQGVGSAASQ